MKEALTFDDVQIIPAYSDISSRSTIKLSSYLTSNYRIDTPIIAAPMDTVVGVDMVVALDEIGAAAAMHRFCSVFEMGQLLVELPKECLKIVSVGVDRNKEQERVETALEFDAAIILVDVAHGEHQKVLEMMMWLNNRNDRKSFDVIAGNVCTAEGASRLEDWGADAIRCGIGGGSVCSTRVMTGVGVPQFTAIQDVVKAVKIPVIADGGIRTPGDAAKALAAGASTVMIGSMLAGCDESPGHLIEKDGRLYKEYRGSASMEVKLATTGKTENVEGVSTLVPTKGPVKDVIKNLTDGIRSSMSYVGVNNLKEFHQTAQFVKVTHAGAVEARPHLLG